MNPFKQQLLSSLENISSAGTFFSSGSNNFLFPKISVSQLDEIAFPLNKIQIQALISVAHKAPFGKGSETILDEKIRNCWEIDADQISFEGDIWQKFIDKIISQIKPDLGIEDKEIEAHLYKMLIYEEGNFFLPHKDSEKEKGMFGTFIIGLPSKHTGGELVLSFDGKEKSISFAEDCSDNKFPHIAFYADCQHEIKPITSGYRVCIVYNLIDLQIENKIKLNSLLPQVDVVTSLLQNQFEIYDKPFIYLLSHQYTPANFSLEQLKLKDRSVAEVLLQAAEKSGYYAKLGLVTSYQSGELVSDYDYGYRRNYYDRDEDDIDMENAEMGEIYDEYITIENWDNSDLPQISINDVSEEELMYNFKLNEGEPIEKEAEGYTGNAGMEMQYWYHYGAVIFWKKQNHSAILTKSTLLINLEWLQYYTKNWNKILNDEKEIAKEIFKCNLNQTYNSRENNTQIFDSIIDFLIKWNDVKNIDEKAKQILTIHFSNISIPKWGDLLHCFSSVNFDDVFLDTSILQDEKKVNHLLDVANYLDYNIYFELIDKILAKLPETISSFDLLKQKNNLTKSLIINSINLVVYKKNDIDWINAMTRAVTQKLDREFVNNYLIQLIMDTNLRTNLLGKSIFSVAQNHLKERVLSKPQPPINWTREVPQSNSYKNVWSMLAPFLKSPTEQVYEFKSLQANRTEVENAIRNTTIDLDTETIRKGSPHTLRLTKNTNEYKSDYKKWQDDCVLFEKCKD